MALAACIIIGAFSKSISHERKTATIESYSRESSHSLFPGAKGCSVVVVVVALPDGVGSVELSPPPGSAGSRVKGGGTRLRRGNLVTRTDFFMCELNLACII